MWPAKSSRHFVAWPFVHDIFFSLLDSNYATFATGEEATKTQARDSCNVLKNSLQESPRDHNFDSETCTELRKSLRTWLRECFRQVEAGVISNSKDELHQTTYQDFLSSVRT